MPQFVPLRIGFLLPASFAVTSRASGIAEQARRQAEALESLGHSVVRLNPWEWQDERELEVLQFFLGGPGMTGVVEHRHPARPGIVVFAPIIDSNESFLAYRMAALLGSLSARVSTVPGILRRQALASDLVVCRSRHEVERVTRGLGVPVDRTAIVLNGCPPTPAPSGDLAQLRRSLDLPDEFVLHVSAFTQDRKNVLRLIEATEQLRYPLVIAGTGKPGPVLEAIQQRARASGNRVRLLGFVDEPTKAALYALCRVFCLPSTHEGTGLVALEAGAAGARVVITRHGGPPDYFRDQAEYVDPHSVRSIRDGIAQAWGKPPSDALRQRIAHELSWVESGKSLERLYRQRLNARIAATHAGLATTVAADATPGTRAMSGDAVRGPTGAAGPGTDQGARMV